MRRRWRTDQPETALYEINQEQTPRSLRAYDGGMWDFKTGKGRIPVGRVFPLAPVETERSAVSPSHSRECLKVSLKASSVRVWN